MALARLRRVQIVRCPVILLDWTIPELAVMGRVKRGREAEGRSRGYNSACERVCLEDIVLGFGLAVSLR